MLFGNKNDFAIEAMVEPGIDPPAYPWGRARIWVSGTSFGDFDEPHCGLAPVYQGFVKKLEVLDELWEEEFANLTNRELWNFLDERLYGWHGDEPVDLPDDDDEWIDYSAYAKYDFLTNWGEMFDHDGKKAFVFNQPSDRLMVLHFNDANREVDAFTCSQASFREAAGGFTRWFKALLDLADAPDA